MQSTNACIEAVCKYKMAKGNTSHSESFLLLDNGLKMRHFHVTSGLNCMVIRPMLTNCAQSHERGQREQTALGPQGLEPS